MYDPNAPEDDMREREEEMERMREHVFRESDTDKNKLISFDEFLAETKREEFEKDPGITPRHLTRPKQDFRFSESNHDDDKQNTN